MSKQTASLAVPEQEFQSEALTLVREAQSIVVRNQDEFEQAVEFGKGVSAFIKKVEAFFKPLKQTAKAAHKALCDKENEILAVPERANEIVHRAANTWKAEQKRRDDEARRIEQARIQKEHEERMASLAAMAEEFGMGDEEVVKPVLPEVDIQPVFQKVAGTRNRTEWHHEVTDKTIVPDQFWMIDEKALRDYAKMMKEKALPGGGFEVPGVRFWSTEETDW